MIIKLISFDEKTMKAEIEFDEEGQKHLLDLGFNALLKQALNLYPKYNPTPKKRKRKS